MYPNSHPLSVVEIIEGYHLTHIFQFFLRYDLLNKLSKPKFPDQIAKEIDVDKEILRLLLCYLSERTNLIVAWQDGRFSRQLTEDITTNSFLFGQYIDAYGPNSQEVESILKNPSLGKELVNRVNHAKAYANLDRPGFNNLPHLIQRLGANTVMDLGCGTGALLIQLAHQNPNFRGWGIDANKFMLEQGRKKAKAVGVFDQITFLEMDAASLEQDFPIFEWPELELLTASSLLNGFFAEGNDFIIAWLKNLSRQYPEKLFLIADYYGRLGKPELYKPSLGLLLDLVQSLSYQGVPPANVREWSEIYRVASCQLLQIFEEQNYLIPSFFHLLKLPQSC